MTGQIPHDFRDSFKRAKQTCDIGFLSHLVRMRRNVDGGETSVVAVSCTQNPVGGSLVIHGGGKTETRTVGGSETRTVGGSETRTVGGSDTVGGSKTVSTQMTQRDNGGQQKRQQTSETVVDIKETGGCSTQRGKICASFRLLSYYT